MQMISVQKNSSSEKKVHPPFARQESLPALLMALQSTCPTGVQSDFSVSSEDPRRLSCWDQADDEGNEPTTVNKTTRTKEAI